MRAPLSIIIPTRNAAQQLPASVLCLVEGLGEGVVRELILADAGGDPSIEELAQVLGARLVTSTPGRGQQLAQGAQAAKGTWLLFLHADTHLSPGWASAVLAHIQNQPERAGWFALAFRGGGMAGRIVAQWANLRALVGLPYGDQGLLISRALYDSVQGYPAIPLMEDVAMARKLRGRLRRIAATAATDPGKFQRNGWFLQGANNLWRLVRYLAGADPATLAKGYDLGHRDPGAP